MIFLLSHENQERILDINCIIYNNSKNSVNFENQTKILDIIRNDSSLMKSFIMNLYENSSSLYSKSLYLIREYKGYFDKINDKITSSLNETNSKDKFFQNLFKIKNLYNDLVKYIAEFRNIINDLEIVKKFIL